MDYVQAPTVPEIFHKRVAATPDKTALMRKREGTWKQISWRDYGERVFEIAWALHQLGVQAGDRVAILSGTRPEWAYADLAILSLGAITVPVYPTLTGDETHYILQDSGARALFCENKAQVAKILPFREKLPGLEHLMSFEKSGQEGVPSLDEFTATHSVQGAARESARLEWRAWSSRSKAEDTASIVYTSGTSGVPKGACVTHHNFVAVMTDAARYVDVGPDDLTLHFLPASHILGRIEQMITLAAGWTTAYAQSLNTLLDDLMEVKPTVLISVPRIYEKVYSGIQKKLASGSWVERQMMKLAFDVARRKGEAQRAGRKLDVSVELQRRLVDKLVFSKIRDRFGGRLRFAITGGAPITREIGEFFDASGIHLLEGFGLTETCGPICVNNEKANKVGTVGRPCPGAEVKIAEDGEILLKGNMVFKGYWNNPEATAESLRDGWFATGDVGEVDSDGFLRITDRKKDLIVTAGGKNVAPQKIESLLKFHPVLSQAIVYGDRRNYLVALITLTPEEIRRVVKLKGWDELKTSEQIAEDKRVHAYVREKVQAVNAQLAPFETVKRFKILPREFSIEAGELTPSLKIKRKFCVQKYAKFIEELYDGPGAASEGPRV